jgi:mevalonate kinase
VDFDVSESGSSNYGLKKLADYLKLTMKNKSMKYTIDIDSFERDLDDGLFFQSDIPKGSGLGSSGAVAAAVFHRYSDAGMEEPDLNELRICLASIESFYHGASSGIDPLVSFMKSPVYFKNILEFGRITIPDEEVLIKSGLFLVNSLKDRNTGSLVNDFYKRLVSDRVFSDKLNNQYIPVNNRCAKSLTGPLFNDEFFHSLKELTRLQLDCFREMIPQNLIPVMNYGLNSNLFFMKLCGAGGGGFMLGFTGDIPETRKYFQDQLPVQVYGEI